MESAHVTSYSLANNILAFSFKDKIPVNSMKLQRMLYYACAIYLQKVGRSLLLEPFQVWQNGPVLASLYYKLKPYGKNPVKEFVRDAKGQALVVNSPYIDACCAFAWQFFKEVPVIQLAERSRGDGSGWNAAYQRGDQIIACEDMKEDTTVP